MVALVSVAVTDGFTVTVALADAGQALAEFGVQVNEYTLSPTGGVTVMLAVAAPVFQAMTPLVQSFAVNFRRRWPLSMA